MLPPTPLLREAGIPYSKTAIQSLGLQVTKGATLSKGIKLSISLIN